MSYILEALRKAERERTLGQVPTLEATAVAEPGPLRRLWPWLLAGALMVNAVVLALWLLNPRAPEPALVTETASREPPPPPPVPAMTDYLPPPITVVEEPISAPPEPVTVAEPTTPPPVESQDEFVEAPAVEDTPEHTPVAQDVPLLRDLPPEFRRSLPSMKIDAHFHTDVPNRSFVMINMRKYKAGERLAEGPQVVEIASDGVILSYQGQQFLLTP